MNADSELPSPLEPLAMQSSSATSGTPTNTQEQHLRQQLELLKQSDGVPSEDSTTRDQKTNRFISPPPISSNGFEQLSAASRDAIRALSSSSKPEHDSFIHPDLRAGPQQPRPQNMMPIASPAGHEPNSSSMPSGSTLAPAPPPPPQPNHGEDVAADGRSRAKRELSQSKRAAQNRAAQRAFRQRKETYIKLLEQEVKEYREIENAHKATQAENYALRDYIITLQARLLEAGQGDFPPPPANIDLSHHQQTAPEPQMAAPEPHMAAPEPHMAAQDTHMSQPDTHMNESPSNNNHPISTPTPLEAVAQAVAGLAAQEQLNDRQQSFSSSHAKQEQGSQDTRTADEINRHLQSSDGAAEPPMDG